MSKEKQQSPWRMRLQQTTNSKQQNNKQQTTNNKTIMTGT